MTEQEGFSLPSEHKRGSRSGRRGTGGRASDVPGVPKDQYGRYLLAPPSDPTGEVEPWTSVTTIVGQASGNEGLRIWTERGIMDGLAASPALRAQLANSTQADRDRIREEAKTLSGLHDAREWGSACHREWEMWATQGNDYPGPPPELAADVTAGITAVLEAGLEVVKVEQVVAIEHLRIAGRLDNLFRAPNGKLRVGDWKTGKDVLTDASKRENFACQFSGYGNNTHLLKGFTPEGYPIWQMADELDIDREIAYLIHVHDGTARIYEVPIADAWRDFQARAITHRHSSSKGAPQFLAIGRPVRFVSTVETPDPMPVTSPSDWPEQHAQEVPDEQDRMTQLGMVLTGQDVGSLMADPNRSDQHGAVMDALNDGVAPVPEEPTTPADPPGGTPESISPHEFETFDGASGMVCTAMVMRNGGGDQCGLGPNHPLHSVPEAQKNGIGEPLQPLAKDVGAKRGCGKCGRVGHRSGSPACLGDADPLLSGPEVVLTFDSPDGPVTRTRGEDIAHKQGGGSPYQADEFCDGECGKNAGVPADQCLKPARGQDGAVTGGYVCAGCGKRATVAAVRAHMAATRTADGYVKPDVPAEQQAAKERVVQPTTIPDPPVQVQQSAPWEAPAQGIAWGRYFSAATTRAELADRVEQCRAAGELTPERSDVAKGLYFKLPEG